MAWWPEDEWRRMWGGDECEMCADAPLATNPFGELHHLTSDERCGFWNDVSTMGEVIYELFDPVKLANLSMGFRTPHVHCHVLPQYQHDDPLRLLNPPRHPVANGPPCGRAR